MPSDRSRKKDRHISDTTSIMPTIRKINPASLLDVPKLTKQKAAVTTPSIKKLAPKKTTKVKRTATPAPPPKKEGWLPGQRYAAPPQSDSLRLFYESLMRQKPHSRMALKWCLEHGLLKPKKVPEAILVLEMDKKLKV